LPTVHIDTHQITQVYDNLLINAIKYTPQNGTVTLTITRKGQDILTQITDTGYGIPTADHNNIFQKFFRGSNIQQYDTDGTGLGMFLSKAIIESSGGKIWFESAEGKGTTFWFTLPISTGDEPSAPASSKPAPTISPQTSTVATSHQAR